MGFGIIDSGEELRWHYKCRNIQKGGREESRERERERHTQRYKQHTGEREREGREREERNILEYQ